MSGSVPACEVVVLGSANLDVVLAVEAIPVPGETLLSTGRADHPGGKGLNQAVAAARAGARTVMLGALGDDEAAQTLRGVATEAGIDVSRLRTEPGSSGRAFICVQPDGENSIIVSPGANANVRRLSAVERAVVASARVLVAQLELPLTVVREGLQAARDASTTTVLNAAPGQPLDRELLELVDVLVVNLHEARTLAGADASNGGSAGTALEADAKADAFTGASAEAARLARRLGGSGAVVVTLGGEGALVLDPAGAVLVPAVAARVVDTTGAGDTFTGVLAASLAQGADLRAAASRAVVAAALSVEKPGAVPSIPSRAEIDERALR